MNIEKVLTKLTKPILSSPHPFRGQSVFVATKHGKEEIFEPLFAEMGMKCINAKVDTDEFGTFTGEVERTGTVKETLLKKIHAASEKYPQANFLLASEGTFGPDPHTGLLNSNLESLLLWHRPTGREFYVDHLTLEVNVQETVYEPEMDLRPFLREIGFSEQAVIVRPEGKMFPLFKGISNEVSLQFAIRDCLRFSSTNRVMVSTDLRACFNPTRRKAIRETGAKLIASLKSLCPRCRYPGFMITDSLPGLACVECESPNPTAKAVIWSCHQCQFHEEKPRPDGKKYLDPYECQYCNP